MGLVDRVKRILRAPRQEWQVIDGEVTTPGDLYKGYIAPLAAIGPIAQAIGYSVFGLTLPFVGTYRTPVGSAIISALVAYVLTLVGVYVLALIIDALAPTFGGTKNQMQALKVAAYSSTASWVAGIFALIPRAQHPQHPRSLQPLSSLSRSAGADEGATGEGHGVHRRRDSGSNRAVHDYRARRREVCGGADGRDAELNVGKGRGSLSPRPRRFRIRALAVVTTRTEECP